MKEQLKQRLTDLYPNNRELVYNICKYTGIKIDITKQYFDQLRGKEIDWDIFQIVDTNIIDLSSYNLSGDITKLSLPDIDFNLSLWHNNLTGNIRDLNLPNSNFNLSVWHNNLTGDIKNLQLEHLTNSFILSLSDNKGIIGDIQNLKLPNQETYMGSEKTLTIHLNNTSITGDPSKLKLPKYDVLLWLSNSLNLGGKYDKRIKFT